MNENKAVYDEKTLKYLLKTLCFCMMILPFFYKYKLKNESGQHGYPESPEKMSISSSFSKS